MFREAAMFVEGTENDISKYYKDEDTFRILAAMVNVIGGWLICESRIRLV